MIEKIEKTIDGEEIKILIPETIEEEEFLKKEVNKGALEDLGSMQEVTDKEVEDILGF